MIDYQELFFRIQDHVGNHELRNRRWIDINCPFCGAESDRNNPRFSFSEKGYNCFVCSAHGNLFDLAKALNVPGFDGMSELPPYTPPPRKPKPEPEPPPAWLEKAEELVEIYRSHVDRDHAWAEYKPLSPGTLDRHSMGLGHLPGARVGAERLVVPLYDGGRVVGLVGRSTDGSEPKWLAAKGSKRNLWNLENVRGGFHPVWVMENYADAALLMQEEPSFDAVATGMARGLRKDEVAFIKERGVKLVVVAMDNDLAGQADGELRQKLRDEWIAERGVEPPLGAGFKTRNVVVEAGINVALINWEDMPAKMDIGAYIQAGMLA